MGSAKTVQIIQEHQITKPVDRTIAVFSKSLSVKELVNFVQSSRELKAMEDNVDPTHVVQHKDFYKMDHARTAPNTLDCSLIKPAALTSVQTHQEKSMLLMEPVRCAQSSQSPSEVISVLVEQNVSVRVTSALLLRKSSKMDLVKSAQPVRA